MVNTVCEKTDVMKTAAPVSSKVADQAKPSQRFQPVSTLLEHCEVRTREQSKSPKLGWTWFVKTA